MVNKMGMFNLKRIIMRFLQIVKVIVQAWLNSSVFED